MKYLQFGTISTITIKFYVVNTINIHIDCQDLHRIYFIKKIFFLKCYKYKKINKNNSSYEL